MGCTFISKQHKSMNLKETQKLLYLERILKLYVQFLRAYSQVSIEIVTRDKGWEYITRRVEDPYTKKIVDVQIGTREVLFEPTRFVQIIYHGTRFDFYTHQTIEFPITHLSKRILHYKRKLMTAFKNRKKNSLFANHESA